MTCVNQRLNEYRRATLLDYAYILRLLTDGDVFGVLVDPLSQVNRRAYPLLEISKPPYSISPEGVHGLTSAGISSVLRITDTELGYVELKIGDGKWFPPEMGSVILLVPK